MRLTKVRVTKLFGLFDHEIPLNQEKRITIIHGPNGFGKTVMLRMMASLVLGNYVTFRSVPFESFVVEFDNGRSLTVKPTKASHRWGSHVRLHFSLDDAKRHETKSWVSYPPGDAVGVAAEVDWIKELGGEMPMARLILTHRLDVVEDVIRDEDKGEGLALKPTVDAYSEDLAERIRQVLAEYATRSQELDRTFPVRLFNQPSIEPLTAEELRRRLDDLEKKRALLIDLGFLEPEQGLGNAPVQALESRRDVLSVYVDDMDRKLALFDEVASRVQVFKRIINERFLFKRLELDRDEGFIFISRTGSHLGPSGLSSGEQHELILFYELLFKLEKNALVLIDEPELSLHVAWQEKFLEDLSEVVRLSEVDVVIATHSPEIIGKHWDLTVELKGPAELRQG